MLKKGHIPINRSQGKNIISSHKVVRKRKSIRYTKFKLLPGILPSVPSELSTRMAIRINGFVSCLYSPLEKITWKWVSRNLSKFQALTQAL